MIRPTKLGHWQKLLTNDIRMFLGDVSLGNGVTVRIGMMRTQRGIFIGLPGHGAGEFSIETNPNDVMEIFGRTTLTFGDFRNLADFINEQMRPPEISRRVIGWYSSVLCDDHAPDYD